MSERVFSIPAVPGHPHGVTTFCLCAACQRRVTTVTRVPLKPITWDQVAEWSLEARKEAEA